MKRQAAVVVLLLVATLAQVSCGGGTPSSLTGGGRGSLAVFGQDGPLDNLIEFEITVVSVVLNPGSVSVLPQPVRFELTSLQLTSDLIRLAQNIPAGNYTSVTLTVSDPEIKFFISSGTCPGGGPGPICEIRPPLQNVTITLNINFTIVNGQTTGLLIDFDLQRSVLTDMLGKITGINPMLTGQILNLAGVPDEFEAEGRVVSVNRSSPTTGSFVFEPFTTCIQVIIDVDGTTAFEDFDEATPPLANSFASLAANQFVDVNADVRADTDLLARKVELEEPDNDDDLEGLIVAVTRDFSGSVTSFQLLLQEVAPCTTAARIGDTITVNLDGSTRFRLDADGFPVNASLFNGPEDLTVGQKVDVDPVGAFASTITADKIKLEDQTIRGTVLSTAGTTFWLRPGADLFPDQNVEVQTAAGTRFDDVSGVSGLTVGQPVRIKGFLFLQALGPPSELVFVATRVDATP